jgi:hypothetical protein
MNAETTMASTPKPGTTRQATTPGATPGERAGSGNSGEDRVGGDEVGAGTFADKPGGPDDLTRGAPPKKKKRYSLAD